MKKLIAYPFSVLLIVFILASCSEREAETPAVINDAVTKILGSWTLIEGISVDRGCGVSRSFFKSGDFSVNTWPSKDITASTRDNLSGTYTAVNAETTLNSDGEEEVRKLFVVSLHYRGWDQKEGCDGKGGEKVGKSVSRYYEFVNDINADGSITKTTNVYDATTDAQVSTQTVSGVFVNVKPDSVYQSGDSVQ